MNTEILIPLMFTTVVAVIGWYVVHVLSSMRERNHKKQDIVVEYLISAWRRLENVAARKDFQISEFESAIADIQLFGNDKQIELAIKASNEFAYGKSTDLGDLLESLRRELRKEMKLKETSIKIKHLRING